MRELITTFFLLFVLFLAAKTCCAQTQSIPQNTPSLELAYYVDADHQSIDAINPQAFTAFSGSKNFGFTKATVWVRVTPQNVLADTNYYLNFWSVFTDELRIFGMDKNGQPDQLLALQGDKKNAQNWQTKNPVKAFEIRGSTSSAVYYYALKNDGLLLVDLQILTLEDYVKLKRNNLINKFIIVGFALPILVWILVSGISIPVTLSLPFFVAQFCMIIIFLFGAGDINQLLETAHVDDDTVTKFLMALLFTCVVLFNIGFLQAFKLNSPVLRALRILSLGVLGVSFVNLFFELRGFIFLIYIYFLVGNLVCLGASIKLTTVSQRLKNAVMSGYFLLCFLPIINLLVFTQKIPIEFFNYNIAIFSAAVFTSFMLLMIFVQTNQFKENALLAEIKLAQEKQHRTIDQRIYEEQSGLLSSLSQEYKTSLAAADLKLSAITDIAQRLTIAAEKPKELQIDREKMQLVGGLATVALSAAELSLLEAFFASRGKVLEYAELGQTLGKNYSYKDWKSLAVIITRLRKKMIAAGAESRCIASVRGQGYQCTVELVIS